MRNFLAYLFSIGLLGALFLVPAPVSAQQGAPRLTCRFDPLSVAVGQSAVLFVEVADVPNLYGYELGMNYDPGRVQLQDGDAGKDGVNLQLGSFLSPDFVLFNTAENGTVQVALTQLAPATPKSGSGNLAQVPVLGLVAGPASFTFGNITLSDANGQAIQVTTQDCVLEVGTEDQPSAAAAPTNTPVPPTATPIATAVPSAAPTATLVPPTIVPTSTTLPTAIPTQPSIPPTMSPTQAVVPTATPTFTPISPTSTNTPLPTPLQTVDVTQTQTEPQATITQIPSNSTVAATSTPTSTSKPTQTPTPEPTSTPTLTSTSIPVVVEATPLPTAKRPTPTPMVLAQGPRQPLPTVQVLVQPLPHQAGIDRHLLDTIRWVPLPVLVVLGFIVWWFRRNL